MYYLWETETAHNEGPAGVKIPPQALFNPPSWDPKKKTKTEKKTKQEKNNNAGDHDLGGGMGYLVRGWGRLRLNKKKTTTTPRLHSTTSMYPYL